MNIPLHKNARTTPRIRAEIQASTSSIAELARHYNRRAYFEGVIPAYSPELTPVERVWLNLKERFLSHRVHGDYSDIVDAICKGWNRLAASPGRLRAEHAVSIRFASCHIRP